MPFLRQKLDNRQSPKKAMSVAGAEYYAYQAAVSSETSLISHSFSSTQGEPDKLLKKKPAND